MKKKDNCIYCGGVVVKKRVQKVCTWGGRLIALVNDVPAGVCGQCGERFYEARVLKQIEDLLDHRKSITKTIAIPVAKYAA